MTEPSAPTPFWKPSQPISRKDVLRLIELGITEVGLRQNYLTNDEDGVAQLPCEWLGVHFRKKQ